ncbi:unnamed protein product [Urochloa humidicola]
MPCKKKLDLQCIKYVQVEDQTDLMAQVHYVDRVIQSVEDGEPEDIGATDAANCDPEKNYLQLPEQCQAEARRQPKETFNLKMFGSFQNM